jgi:hypothetical protein
MPPIESVPAKWPPNYVAALWKRSLVFLVFVGFCGVSGFRSSGPATLGWSFLGGSVFLLFASIEILELQEWRAINSFYQALPNGKSLCARWSTAMAVLVAGGLILFFLGANSLLSS